MNNSQEDLTQVIMQLIMHGGDAKSSSMEAIYAAKEKNFNEAEKKLEDADESLTEAHNSQSSLLTKETSGEKVELSLLMVHAQDHLMNAITFKDLAIEVIDVYKELASINKEIN